MTPSLKTFRGLAATGLLLALSATPGFAVDADEVAARLKALFAEQSFAIDWTSASGDGDTVTLSGVTVGGATPGEKIPVGDVTLEGVSEEDGDYYVETVSLPALTQTSEGITVEMSGLSINGLELPEKDPAALKAEIVRYESANIERLNFRSADSDVFTLTNFAVEVEPTEDEDAPISFAGSAEALRADLSKVLEPQQKAVMDALGYTTFEGSMEMAGEWSPTDGRSKLEQFDISIDKAGTLGLALEMSGYTPEFMKAMQDIQAKAAAQPGGEADAAQGMAMLGLMQQLTFISAEISFEDDSLTSRTLDYVATQQRAKPADIANQAKAILPFLLAQLKNPEFSAQVASAVSAYLDNPKNIKIRARPAAPVPVAMLAAGAMTAPESLIGSLNVSVAANE